MKRPIRNRAHSTHERLLHQARERHEDPQLFVQRYVAERFLYRLGTSSHRERFVLKGAMLFVAWGGSIYRPTRDLDFTGYGSSEVDALRQALHEICELPGGDDDIEFDASTLVIEPIQGPEEYGGLRAVFDARLAAARIRTQIDVGWGDAVEPPPEDIDYPTLLDAPAPRIRSCPREVVIAEKLHAMKVLGELNSRFKDFHDLYVLARDFTFEGARLCRAITATFERRRTAIDSTVPLALTASFYADGERATRWRTFLERNGLVGVPSDFAPVGEMLNRLLAAPWIACAESRESVATWSAGGPWR